MNTTPLLFVLAGWSILAGGLPGARSLVFDQSILRLKAIDVAAALIFHGGKLLITQRRPDDHLPNLWEFPGGKLEPGETFESCLVREIREELGLEVEVRELVEDLTHTYPEKTVRLRFYNCRLLGGEPRALHCQAFAWVSRHELSHFQFPAADVQLIERLSTQAWPEY